MRYLLLFFLFFSTQSVFGILPHAYVTDQQGGSVRIIDITNDTVQTIFGFNGPRVIKVTEDGTLAYVGSDDNTIRIIDTITHTVLPTAINIDHPVALALTPGDKFMYITSANNTVSIVQTSDYTIRNVITGFDNPQDIKITPDGLYAYVSNSGNGTVSVIRTADNTIVDTITGFQTPIGLTFTKDGVHAYITDTSHNAIYVLDTSDNTIDDVILGFNLPSYIVVTPDKTTAYVSNVGDNTIAIVRTSDNAIIGSIPIPVPKSLAVTQDGLYLYVGSDFGTVFKVRILNNTILIAIPGFQNPSNITLTTNNAPCNSVNGCQVVTPTDIYNQVTWHMSAGSPIAYKIYRDVNLTHLIGTFSAEIRMYTDKGRQQGQSYVYYVVAVYENGFSSTIGSVEVGPIRVCQGS
jgi:YVTN family beta-propeller protein